MRRFLHAGLAILATVYLVPPALADLSPLEITEEDGAPSTFPYQVKFPNGSVTDNGDGTTSVSSGGAPTTAEYVVTEASGDLSAEVAPSAANQVPNSTSSTAGSWTATPTVQDATLSDTTPSLVFTDTSSSEDDFEAIAEGSVFRIVNTTDGITSLIHYANNGVGLGEVGMAPGFIHLHTDGTGDGELRLPTDSVGIQELDATDEPADGESYTFDSTTGRGEWASGGSGNSFETIAVPDTNNPVADSSSDTLTLTESAGIDITGTAATDTINIAPDLTELTAPTFGSSNLTNVSYSTSGDDYEWWFANNLMGLANTTEGTQILATTQSSQLETLTQLIVRGGADLRGIITAMGATVVSQPLQISKTVVDPDTAQTNSDAYPLFDVDSAIFPFGIRISSITIGTNTAASIAYALEEWTSPTSGVASTICGLNLVSASERTFTGGAIADPTVAAGSWVFLNLDTTALTWFTITVRFHALTA